MKVLKRRTTPIYTPSSRNSTFRRIEEVEKVSADVAGDENRSPTLEPAEETSTSGQGKSPRVVISARFPHFDPTTVAHIASTLPLGGLPAAGEASSSIPPPGDANLPIALPSTSYKKMEFLNSDNVRHQECVLTRAEDYKNAHLEPPDYSWEGKYEPKPASVTIAAPGMVLDKGFITAPNAHCPSRGKVALGAMKAAAGKGPSNSSGPNIRTVVPLEILTGSATASNLQVAHAQS
nr:hypothetical protein Iba_chr03cCG5040 [Ipomoea batatas]